MYLFCSWCDLRVSAQWQEDEGPWSIHAVSLGLMVSRALSAVTNVPAQDEISSRAGRRSHARWICVLRPPGAVMIQSLSLLTILKTQAHT